MPRKPFTVALACALLTAALAAAAQEAPKKQELVVYTDHVKPSMVEAYTAVGKDMVALLKEERADAPAFVFWAFSGPDLGFSYVTPMDGFGAMDTMHEAWMALHKGPDKAKWEALDGRMNAAISCSERLVAARVPEACYTPKQPRLTMEEARYRWFDVFQVMLGKETEFVAECRARADLSAKVGFQDMWMAYAVLVGGPMPTFVLISPVRDPGDYAASEAAWRKAAGDEGTKHMQALLAITQHYEGHGQWYLPELSYQGPAERKAATEKEAKAGPGK